MHLAVVVVAWIAELVKDDLTIGEVVEEERQSLLVPLVGFRPRGHGVVDEGMPVEAHGFDSIRCRKQPLVAGAGDVVDAFVDGVGLCHGDAGERRILRVSLSRDCEESSSTKT